MSKKNLLLQFFGWAIKHIYYAADVIVSVTDSFKAELINKQLDNFTFINRARQDAINMLNMLDASIVHLRNTPLFKTVIPSKIFEAIALGKRILMGVKGESREIVIDQAQADLAFELEDPESLNKAITVMRTQAFDKNKPIEFVRQNFDREKIAIKMMQEISAKFGK